MQDGWGGPSLNCPIGARRIAGTPTQRGRRIGFPDARFSVAMAPLLAIAVLTAFGLVRDGDFLLG